MPIQRFSHQREQIFQTVQASCKHPTAKDVYDTLKPQMPQLSLGTVYRNLSQLVEEGKLIEIGGQTLRYDAAVAPHTHFRCMQCGAVIDLHMVPYDATLDSVELGEKHIIEGHELMFSGICSACAEKQNMKRKKRNI